MKLNQSHMLGETSLLNSTHMAQLQESLCETKRSLECSRNAQQVSEKSRRQLKAKLDDYQRRHDEVVGLKLTLESNKLDLELEVHVQFECLNIVGKGHQSARVLKIGRK